ncbi:amino acid adenylation domain-containing protein [Streptomyces sp. NPDC046862]|uniref:amino acid adenylation domain-containing protein n=1 Tax=Streptomyces sp. NPDC046862 TaxID=3154603 RepID=UPI003452A06E
MNHDHLQDTDEQWPPVLLPADRPRRPGAVSRCTAAVHAAFRTSTGTSARPDLLTAALAAVLFRYTGQDRVAVDTAEGTVRFRVSGTSTLGRLAEEAAPGDGPAPVGIRFDEASDTDDTDDTEGTELQLVVHDGSLELRYDTGLFDEATAERLLAHYRTLTEDAVREPSTPVSQLRLLTDAELHRTLVEWNATDTELPHGTCLHEAFEARVAEQPDAVAVVHPGGRRTFAEVDADANRLAHELRSLGVGPDVRVGLCLDRSPALLVAILGILKAGGAYVPLDPEYPAQRIAAMAEGTACAVMVSRADLTGNLPEDAGRKLVLLDRDGGGLADRPAHNPGVTVSPENLCYVIHTSGSTGKPKPIALQHRGVMNNLADLNSRFSAGPGDKVLSLSSPSFDMSVYEYLGITTAGGTVVVPSPERTKDPAHWHELLTAEDVTVWNTAPALLELLVDHLEQTGAQPLPHLRAAMLGGDWIPVPLPDRVRALAPNLRLLTLGGVTEASIHSTIYEVGQVDPEWASIPYGRPMANQHTYVLDDHRRPVPPGVAGELYVGGIGVAREYLGQPEKTAERFVDWSHAGVTDRVYRTGDLARFTPDGMIELLGRIDFQVKLNGLRVELGEIEAVLRSHPAVQASAVVAHRNRLVAYVVTEDAGNPENGGNAGNGVDTGELVRLAAAKLPAFMVPAAIVPLERLPLTPNGKVDRKALPEPDLTGGSYRAPGGEREEVLAAVFADVLGVERVGVDDDFLALGGDSIRAIKVVTRARARGVEITPKQVLQSRTVAVLAAAAGEAATAGEESAADSTPLVAVGVDDLDTWRRRYPGLADVWPLTPMQSGMLFESMLSDGGHDAYQMQTLFTLTGEVDADRLRAAGQTLLDRYANLRTAFVPDVSGTLVQLVVDGVTLPWREIDLSDLPDAEQAEALRRFLTEDRTARFDRSVPPLLRLTLVRLSPVHSELVLTSHHVLLDGWSEQVLGQDLLRLYAAGGEGELPAVRSFRDFLAWLDRQDQRESTRAWADELAGVDEPTTLVPATAPRAEAGEVAEVALRLTPEEGRRLAARGSQLGVTLNTLVQGAWAVLLGGLTGRDDVVFGAAVSGRPADLPGVESMVGLFINTVPVRARCAPDSTLAELMTGLQERQTALLDHHHHPLTEIHKAAGLDALFDTLVAFQSYPVDRAPGGGLEITGVRSVGGANYPLALIVESDPEVRLTLQYHPSLFERGTAEDIAARLRSVLGQVAADPDELIGGVDLLLPDEEQRLTGPVEDLPAQTVTALFDQRVAATPDAVAVSRGGESLTYAQLDERAHRVAAALAGRGAGPETVVGLRLPPSVDLAVALIGTLRAGAAYTVLTSGQHGPELTLTTLEYADPAAPAPARVGPQQLACVRPGAVAVGHRALVNGLKNYADSAGLAPGTRLVAASPAGDPAAFEILAGLCAGAGIRIGTDDGWGADVISTVAPVLAAALDGHPEIDAATVVLTGDVLLGSLVQRLRETVPGVRIVTAYGPTETIRAAALTAAEGWQGDGPAPLGSVLGNMRAYVLDPFLRQSPAGVTGELYIAGELARGYQDRPVLTAQRFVSDPYGPPGSRMYRTGDLVRWGAGGRLEYAGRLGAWAKVRGHHFQTGDIEAVLAAHPEVSQAAVTADGEQIAAYVVGTPAAHDTDELREFTAKRLPDYMVPTAFVPLTALPLTADGTVDREALAPPEPVTADDGYRPGRTPQEEAMCALFAEVLKVDRVGIDDNFFNLGGNSLTATRLIGQMRRRLGIETSIRTLFQHPSIAELSGRVTTAKAGSTNRPRLRKMTKEQSQ